MIKQYKNRSQRGFSFVYKTEQINTSSLFKVYFCQQKVILF